MPPDKRSGPHASTGRPPGIATSTVTRKHPPIAPASVYAPDGRRRWWHFTFRCKVCGSYNFGRTRDLGDVARVRKAACGHIVTVMAARVYSGPETS